ncbi:MAG TPA: hypothetical protein VK918_06285 [Pyrinomonadaceae bacterium]|nr:hypothetical protein [Pyrinomonadaceae bacterium]
MQQQDLGKLISIHTASPAYLQRAAVVAILSLVFFIVTIGLFYLRQWIGYFVLASGFLVVNLFTLAGFRRHRRSVLRIYESGFSYRGTDVKWGQVSAVEAGRSSGLRIKHEDGTWINIPDSIDAYENAARAIYLGHRESQASLR